jgi:methylmalonyl-CoA mutase N-terminal domain/subunit
MPLPDKTHYTPDDLPDLDYARDLGDPGRFPFTRGIHPDMYRGKVWTMRQYAGYASAEETNRRFRYLLAQGQTGLSVAFDLPTQIGYDSDHPLAEGEVGRVGVPISCLPDLERLLEEIPLENVSISMTINATAPMLLALLVALAGKRGIPPGKLTGTIQNDILKEFVARGTQRFPLPASMKLATDVIEYAHRELPRWNPISISGYHMREAGCSAVQEIAFTLAHGLAYVEAARGRGLDPERFAGRLSFFFGSHNRLFEEVAKFRAARRLWARLLRERFGIRSEEACRLRFHTQTCGSTLTARQPENNLIRVTVQALAAVLGGTQSLHTNAFDEALGLPTEASALRALRTQQILAHESGIVETADPLGGSYQVEHLTDRLEREARELIERVDQAGGAVEAAQSGFTSAAIRRESYRTQQAIDSEKLVVVGVNRYQDRDPLPSGGMRIDPDLRKHRIAELVRHRAGRDAARLERARTALLKVAGSGDNILPSLIEGMEAGMTVGESCRVLEDALK